MVLAYLNPNSKDYDENYAKLFKPKVSASLYAGQRINGFISVWKPLKKTFEWETKEAVWKERARHMKEPKSDLSFGNYLKTIGFIFTADEKALEPTLRGDFDTAVYNASKANPYLLSYNVAIQIAMGIGGGVGSRAGARAGMRTGPEPVRFGDVEGTLEERGSENISYTEYINGLRRQAGVNFEVSAQARAIIEAQLERYNNLEPNQRIQYRTDALRQFSDELNQKAREETDPIKRRFYDRESRKYFNQYSKELETKRTMEARQERIAEEQREAVRWDRVRRKENSKDLRNLDKLDYVREFKKYNNKNPTEKELDDFVVDYNEFRETNKQLKSSFETYNVEQPSISDFVREEGRLPRTPKEFIDYQKNILVDGIEAIDPEAPVNLDTIRQEPLPEDGGMGEAIELIQTNKDIPHRANFASTEPFYNQYGTTEPTLEKYNKIPSRVKVGNRNYYRPSFGEWYQKNIMTSLKKEKTEARIIEDRDYEGRVGERKKTDIEIEEEEEKMEEEEFEDIDLVEDVEREPLIDQREVDEYLGGDEETRETIIRSKSGERLKKFLEIVKKSGTSSNIKIATATATLATIEATDEPPPEETNQPTKEETTEIIKSIPKNKGSYDIGNYHRLYDHFKLTRDKLYELVNDCVQSYDETIEETPEKYFIRDLNTSTEVLIKTKGDYFTIAFRGTEMTKFKDWKTDFMSKSSSFSVSRLSDMFPFIGVDDDLYCHFGFLSRLRSVYDKIIQKMEIYENMPFDLTGHSLGGALASVFGYIYSLDPNIDNKPNLRYFVTFGSPRVFYNDVTLNVDRFDILVEMIRVFNHNDIISYLPSQESEAYTMGMGAVAMGGLGLVMGRGSMGGLLGGIAGGMAGGLLGGFKHIGVGVMLYGELTQTPYSFSGDSVLLSQEQHENHYKIIPKGKDEFRSIFNYNLGGITALNAVSSLTGWVGGLITGNPEISQVYPLNFWERTKAFFKDKDDLFKDFFEDHLEKQGLIESAELMGETFDAILPTNYPRNSISQSAISHFYKKQLPKLTSYIFYSILRRFVNSDLENFNLDALKEFNEGMMTQLIIENVMEKEGTEKLVEALEPLEIIDKTYLEYLTEKVPEFLRGDVLAFSEVKEILNNLYGGKMRDYLNEPKIYLKYIELAEETKKIDDFNDWSKFQYITHFSGIAQTIANGYFAYYGLSRIMGHLLGTYKMNILQLPKDIHTSENRYHSIEVYDGKEMKHNHADTYSGHEHNEKEEIERVLKDNGINYSGLKETKTNLKLVKEGDDMKFKHSPYKVIGFTFYDPEDKNKLVVFR